MITENAALFDFSKSYCINLTTQFTALQKIESEEKY